MREIDEKIAHLLNNNELIIEELDALDAAATQQDLGTFTSENLPLYDVIQIKNKIDNKESEFSIGQNLSTAALDEILEHAIEQTFLPGVLKVLSLKPLKGPEIGMYLDSLTNSQANLDDLLYF